MVAIKIEYDGTRTQFKTELPVLVTHLNYADHLGYDSMLTLIQDARIRWLHQHGMREIAIDDGVGFVVASVAVNYKSEGQLGDELLIELYSDNIKKTSFDLYYRVSQRQSGKLVALAYSSQVFVNVQQGKMAKTPAKFIEACMATTSCE